jgi:hypothetical protein
MMTVDPGDKEQIGWWWRTYDVFERMVVGGVLGWAITIPLLIFTGGLNHDWGVDGYAGDYAWYATIPLGMIVWLNLRRGRTGGWKSRATFGGASGALLATAMFTSLKMAGYSVLFDTKEIVLAVYFWAILVPMLAWPVIMRFIYPRYTLPNKNGVL